MLHFPTVFHTGIFSWSGWSRGVESSFEEGVFEDVLVWHIGGPGVHF